MNPYIKYYPMCEPTLKPWLPVMLVAAGEECVTTSDYRWHGLERGPEPRLIWQYGVRGEGCLERRGERYRLKPGQAMLLPIPDDHCYWLPSGSAGLEIYYMQLMGEEARRIGESLVDHYGPVFDVSPESRIARSGWNIVERSRDRSFRSNYDVSLACYGFLMALCDWLAGTGGSGKHSVMMDRIERMLLTEFGPGKPEPTVEALRKCAGYSALYFERVFKQETGMSPTAFLQQRRVTRACELLRNTTLSIKEIASLCGFYDCALFCRRFKAAMKLTPSQYRGRN